MLGVLTRTASKVSELAGRNHPVIRRLRPTYERILDVASGMRGVDWPVNGEPYRIDPRVRHLVAQTGEPELWGYLRSQIGANERILDVGAFLGTYAIMMARWGGEQTRVLAFEPTPWTLPLLQRHVRLNAMAERITVIPNAVGAEPGYAELHEHSDPYRNALGVTDPNGIGTRTTRVPVTTLDSVCQARGFAPTFLRMDVQGFEHAVLRGARETIRSGRGRLRMVLEVHPQLWGLQGVDERSFDALLEELGLRAVPLRPGAPRYEADGHVTLEYV